jgi:Ulp1 family protease
MILRYTKKKNITKDSTILMPINNRNHWYFAKFEDNHLVIYDSIRHQPNYYLDNKIFKDALKFGKSVFGEEPALVVSQPYPQQNNQYDCGVFMLLGIRDSLRRKEWSFHQGDMRYKRVQIALEVLNCKLALNE